GAAVAWRQGFLGRTAFRWPGRNFRFASRRAPGLAAAGSRTDAGVMTESNLELAVIGNGRTAALVEPSGRIVWWCLPRYDGDPVFCRLLAGNEEKGFTDVVLDRQVENRSEYLRNTAMVVTELTDGDGGAVRITDFAPRFANYGRVFRPPQLIRIIEPIAGMPRVTIRF